MQKFRALLPRHNSTASVPNEVGIDNNLNAEIGFQITIESVQPVNEGSSKSLDGSSNSIATRTVIPELNVHLIAARHLPSLFGFKIVQGYLVKVKLFPGTKRIDSSIQTNSWPKFNENFRFPLVPKLKPSLKHSTKRISKTLNSIVPEDLFAGQFVVFTVYALLELPPSSMNRFSKTYRSLREKGNNLVQKVAESGKSKDDKETIGDGKQRQSKSANCEMRKTKRKPSDTLSLKESMPPLTLSEARRNIGSVTCYLDPKLFQRNSRTGLFTTEEMWLPLKDITTTVTQSDSNNLCNAAKGIVEVTLQVKELNQSSDDPMNCDNSKNRLSLTNGSSKNNPSATQMTQSAQAQVNKSPYHTNSTAIDNSTTVQNKNPNWNRMTSEVKRKMGISNVMKPRGGHDLVLRVTTSRMRCSQKAKDELESTAGSVYMKTTVYERGIYIDAWKSSPFFPSLSTKWDEKSSTLEIPIKDLSSLGHILIRNTLATKSKMGKKLVLGTVIIESDSIAPFASTASSAPSTSSGDEQMKALSSTMLNQPVAMWHSYK